MTECLSFAQGHRMRVTRLDGCGRPATGDDPSCVSVVSEGFVSVAIAANLLTGTDITQTNAAGKLCVVARSPDQFRNHDVTLTFCEVDPDLFAMVTNSRPVTGYVDGVEETVGFRTVEGAPSDAYALEVWMGVPGQQCVGEASTGSYGYVLLPFVVPGALGDFTIENGAVTFTTSGYTKGGSDWDVGPYDVVPDQLGDPGPLPSPIESDVHAHLQWTTVAPPDASCGCVPLAA